jgi:hypothetical protein
LRASQDHHHLSYLNLALKLKIDDQLRNFKSNTTQRSTALRY